MGNCCPYQLYLLEILSVQGRFNTLLYKETVCILDYSNRYRRHGFGVSDTTLDRGSEITSLPSIQSETAGPSPLLYRLGTLEDPVRIICKLTKVHPEIRSIRRPCSFQAATNPDGGYG